MDAVAEVKSRVLITDVCRDYGSLHPTGQAGKFKMVCPFHDDHDPSMVVNEHKGFAWCFVCNSGGDIFSFIQRAESCSFREALTILGEKAGVNVQTVTPEVAKAKKEAREELFDIMEEATVFFEKQLNANPRAKQYVDQRQLPPNIIKQFRVGFAPDGGHALEKHLVEKGFARKQMLQAGLLTAEDSSAKTTKDKFRNRIMFPIWNTRGNVCAFGGRYIGDFANAPKYLNSPETALYKKSDILYGYHFAKDAIAEQKFAILVEGYFDVLACHAVGITNVVAVSGTAFTHGHAKLILRTGNSIALALDVDEAGQAAARRSAVIALKAHLDVEVISIPGGKDPDEAVRENREQFLAAINERKPYMDAFVLRSLLHRDLSSIADKKRILDELLPILNAIPREIEREHHADSLAKKLGSSMTVLTAELREYQRLNDHQPLREKPKNNERKLTPLQYILGMVISWPEYFHDVKEQFLIDLLPDCDEKTIYNVFEHHYNSTGKLALDSVWSELNGAEVEKWRALGLYTEERAGTFPDALRHEELTKLVSKLNMTLITEKIKLLGKQLQQSPDQPQEIVTQISELTKLLHNFHNS